MAPRAMPSTRCPTQCQKTICQACDVQMEIRGQDLCPFCRAEPMSPADELARLEHWAAKDSAAAVCQLGSCYRRGDLGLEIDSPRAVALYERAVELGDDKAVVHLGLMLADGDGCPKDEARAAALFEALSKSKGPWAPWAENALGRLATNPHDAEKHWLRAAEDGFSIAMVNLGSLYEGRFSYAMAFPTDLKLAKSWYQAAAEHGREDAAFNLQRLRAAEAPKGRMTHAFRAFEGLLAA
jgi:TPR repeat protein